MLIDLQLHSTYSDGYLTPAQLVRFIKNKGIKAAALTDHNTVGGLEEFKFECRKKGIKPISGVEIYTKFNNHKLNILWYNFNEADPELHKLLRETHIRRKNQVRNVLSKLKKRGFNIDINKCLDKYSRYIPVNRVVDDFMADKQNSRRIKKELNTKLPREEEVIQKYFKNKKIGALKECYIKAERVFKLRAKAGGQLVICHPAKHGYINKKAWVELKKMGLDGVEVLSPHHSIASVMRIQQLARELDLIGTGGSDFHRFEGMGHSVQSSLDYYKIDLKKLRKIYKIIG